MLTWSRWPDLFWTFFDSLYLTTFKLLFIGSSAYIIYLMLNDYKPTHDPNIDTFKVQYLLGISAILAVLFPHDYRFSEVGLYPKEVGAPVSCLMTNRFSGPSRSGWSPLPSCRSSSCYNEREKLIRSPHTTCLPWVCTGPSISRIGCTATSPKLTSNGLSNLSPSLLASSRPYFTRISSTFTTTSKPWSPCQILPLLMKKRVLKGKRFSLPV